MLLSSLKHLLKLGIIRQNAEGVFVIKVKTWLSLIALLILVVSVFFAWQDNNRYTALVKVMDNMPDIDQVSVNDGSTFETILSITDTDPLFNELTDLPTFYSELNWRERTLIQGNPEYKIDYLTDNESAFIISIYPVDGDDLSRLPDDQESIRATSFSYVSTEDQATYVFALKSGNLIYGVTEGMEQLIDMLIDM